MAFSDFDFNCTCLPFFPLQDFFTSIRHVHIFYYYQPTSQWVYGEERLFIPQTHNRFQRDHLSHPALEKSKRSKTWVPPPPSFNQDKAGRSRYQHLDELGRHVPGKLETRSELTYLGFCSGEKISFASCHVHLDRQLVEVIRTGCRRFRETGRELEQRDHPT